MGQQDLSNMSPEEILELQKKNCIFCKIISKEIPSHEIYSDEKVLVILDINPANEGHCLILPKNHYQILPQLPSELIEHMFNVGKKLSRSVLKALGVKGTTFFVANGAIAGQKAPHFMVHIIPRKPADTLFNVPKNVFEDKDLEETRLKLQGKLGGVPPEQAVKQESINTIPSNEELKSIAELSAPKQVVSADTKEEIQKPVQESQEQTIQEPVIQEQTSQDQTSQEPMIQNESIDVDSLEDALGLLNDKETEPDEKEEGEEIVEETHVVEKEQNHNNVDEFNKVKEEQDNGNNLTQSKEENKKQKSENELKPKNEKKGSDIDDIANLFLGK
jgi:histidine triad (HIT) family protein